MLSLALLGTSVSLTGCGSSSKKAENGELNLFIWTEYVPDSVISDFEKEYGIKVNVSTFSSNEDMLAKVKSVDEGTYDIVQPSDYMVESMIKQEMLEKLDQKALTNLSNIGDQYLDPSYDPGNVYSVFNAAAAPQKELTPGHISYLICSLSSQSICSLMAP